MRLGIILVLLATITTFPASAEVEPEAEPAPAPIAEASAPGSAESAAVEDQSKEIERQLALIEEQKKRIESQEGDIKELQRQLADMEQTLLSLKRRLDELEAAGTPQPKPTDVATESEAQAQAAQAAEQPSNPEVPANVVSAGDFPGSIRIPGSDAAVKFGALIRTAFVFTLAPLGSDTSFLTYTIPVGPPPPGDGPRTAFSANTSRFNVDFRTPTGIGQIRAFIEGDFTGAGNTFYLRQAYAQYRGGLVGQTWSTFSDPEAAPEDIDFEGVSSKNEIRQPQIRYTWFAGQRISYAVAAETPAVSITGGVGVNLVPDIVGRIIWRPKENAHLQFATVLRQVRGQSNANPADTKSDAAWGLTVSAKWPFQRWHLTDNVMFQVNAGVGIARYIKDLNGNGGEDGVFDNANGDLVALPVLGWYVAYQHMWRAWEATRKMNLRSSIIASLVYVDNPEFQNTQDPSAYYRTQRYAANLVFSPSPRIDVGVEYIWGERKNLDGLSGRSSQIQLVGFFRF